MSFEPMTPELQAYIDHDPNAEEGGWDKHRELRDAVPADVLTAYYRYEKDQCFLPEKENVSSRKEFVSPSGKYKLVTSAYETKPGCWRYTQGRVYLLDSDEPVAIVNRNYAAFPFLFVEDHPNGHPYLVGGSDYQGQTVIELDTGARRDFLPKEAADGVGFCWAGYEFYPETQILLVEGCYWACPYEYRFYDFSDPMSGWPHIDPEDDCIDTDERKPTFEPDGTIKTYQTGRVEDDSDECEKLGPIAATKTWRRDGHKLVLVTEDVAPEEQERRIRGEKAQREYDEFVARYKATDPLWLRAMTLLAAETLFKPEEYMGIGVTHKNWCPHWTGEERRFCRRIHYGRGKGWTFDLEIAHATGPVKLCVYKDGQTQPDQWFEHSVEGVEQAFAYARERLTCEA